VSDEPRYPRDVPPLWLLGALLTIAALHWLWPVGTVLTGRWTWFGWELAGACALLTLGSAWLFWRRKTGIRPFHEATTLVAAGPFRFTRNPMYVGMVGLVAGIALGLGTLTPLVVPPLFWFVLDRRFVRHEERFLRARFGAAYDDYCRRVRRWL
jgi:protein-S-isoprenylcysteine O-methyltransferase Ste14